MAQSTIIVLNTEGLNYVDIRTYLLVYGYIRMNEKYLEFSCDSIPLPIYHICLRFYYIVSLFGKHSKSIKIFGNQRNQMILDKVKGASVFGSHTCYSKYWIHSLSKYIITYKIKINQCQIQYSTICIGISSDDTIIDDNFAINKYMLPWYAFDNWGAQRMFNAMRMKQAYHQGFTKNDIITLILNLKNKTLTIMINDDLDRKHCIENIKTGPDIKYKFAISAWYRGDSLSVIHHSIQT